MRPQMYHTCHDKFIRFNFEAGCDLLVYYSTYVKLLGAHPRYLTRTSQLASCTRGFGVATTCERVKIPAPRISTPTFSPHFPSHASQRKRLKNWTVRSIVISNVTQSALTEISTHVVGQNLEPDTSVGWIAFLYLVLEDQGSIICPGVDNPAWRVLRCSSNPSRRTLW
jgi:hypothetical protein